MQIHLSLFIYDTRDSFRFVRLRALNKWFACTDRKIHSRGLKDDIFKFPELSWALAYISSKRGITKINWLVLGENTMWYNTPQSVVDCFADYFVSVFTPVLKDSNLCCERESALVDSPRLFNSDVNVRIKKLKGNIASGTDGISAFLIQDCFFVLVPTLCSLICFTKRQPFPRSGRVP